VAKKHKTLRVIINPWFAPYTMADNNQEVRGIVGDILNLISLQTGLQYETVVVNSHEDMLSEMKKGNWHIVQAAAYDLSLQNASPSLILLLPPSLSPLSEKRTLRR
jgi:two-component system sensor histidine kinase EvgS